MLFQNVIGFSRVRRITENRERMKNILAKYKIIFRVFRLNAKRRGSLGESKDRQGIVRPRRFNLNARIEECGRCEWPATDNINLHSKRKYLRYESGQFRDVSRIIDRYASQRIYLHGRTCSCASSLKLSFFTR